MVTDEQLVVDYIGGRSEAFDELVHRYMRPLFHYTLRLTGDKDQAEDSVQEAFLRAWKHLSRFDTGRQFRSWLYRIARNAALDALKKKRTVPFANFEFADGANMLEETIADPSPWADEVFDKADEARQVGDAVSKLPAPFQEVINLRHNDDLTFREIAEILEEPLDTVKSRYQRGLIKLKNLLLSPE